MVFLPTARQTGFTAEVLGKVPGLEPIYEIHSKLSQPKRTRVVDEFSKAKSGVLFSSDVTARGMDFPGYFSFIFVFFLDIPFDKMFYLSVTLVVQLGLPTNSDQYIHRLGRTARAGAVGRGILVLSQEEEFFVKDSKAGIAGLPIHPLSASSTPPGPTSETVQQAHTELQPILAALPDEEKGRVYRAWMGYYYTFRGRMGWTKADLVHEAGLLAVSSWGWTESNPPAMDPIIVGKMGLTGVPGLNIVPVNKYCHLR
jgi:ATP-dependent RNA helicase MSS116